MTPPAQAEIEYEERESKVHRRRIASLAPQDERGSAERRARELEQRLETLEREQERLRLALSPHAEAHPRVHAARRASGTGTVPRKPRIEGMAAPHRVDVEARKELATMHVDRRDFLRKSAIGAGILALGAGLGYGSGYAQAAGLSGGTRTVITDKEIAARVIGGVRIATEFIPDPVPAGTGADPYPGSAIQAALNDGLAVYVPSGTWRLSSTISRPVDSVNVIGAGKSTKLVLDGVTPCISAGPQNGWLIANLATDAGGVHIDAATESRITEIWVDGVLRDNRPRSSGGGGSGGYYGVRAEDYITSGTGTPSNPYNASAIQSAINSLPDRGGIVFIKEGVWSGTTRIRLGDPASGNPSWKVILQGAGTERDYLFEGSGPPNYYQVAGTHVACGFDVFTPTDFYDMTVSTHPSRFALDPVIKFNLDPTIQSAQHRWIGGFTMKRVKVQFGNPGIWMTATNFSQFADSWQIWNVVLEQVFFLGGVQAMKIDKGGDPRTGQIQMCMKQIGASGVNGARTFDFDVDNTWGTWSDFYVEACGAGADYCIYWRGIGSHGGQVIENVFFGDGSQATKDAYISSLRGLNVLNFMHVKAVDIEGTGYFQFGQYPGTGTPGNVNISALGAGGHIIVEAVPGQSLAIGTLTNPSSIYIREDVVVGANTLRVLRRQA